jgi:ribosomal-protein-alanine N-acetyltransferase
MDLQSERLRVRALDFNDAAFILELQSEPAWLEFIGDRGVRDIETAKSYLSKGPIEMYSKFGFGLCAVELRETGQSVGICGLLKRESLPEPDLGFAILERFWGHGIATEASTMVLAHASNVLNLQSVLAITALNNFSCMRVLEKCGFHFDKVIRSNDAESKLYVRKSDGSVAGRFARDVQLTFELFKNKQVLAPLVGGYYTRTPRTPRTPHMHAYAQDASHGMCYSSTDRPHSSDLTFRLLSRDYGARVTFTEMCVAEYFLQKGHRYVKE